VKKKKIVIMRCGFERLLLFDKAGEKKGKGKGLFFVIEGKKKRVS